MYVKMKHIQLFIFTFGQMKTFRYYKDKFNKYFFIFLVEEVSALPLNQGLYSQNLIVKIGRSADPTAEQS